MRRTAAAPCFSLSTLGQTDSSILGLKPKYGFAIVPCQVMEERSSGLTLEVNCKRKQSKLKRETLCRFVEIR